MAQFVINHHYFYDGENLLSRALRGPSPQQFEEQIRVLKSILKPARTIQPDDMDDVHTFFFTIDDGSKSILDIAELVRKHELFVVVCLCGAPVVEKKVLKIHKINLLRSLLGDSILYQRLRSFFGDDFGLDKLPLRGGVIAKDLYRYDELETKKLKIALNYQLSDRHSKTFLDEVFRCEFGDEEEWASQLYLSWDEISDLRQTFKFAYHGYQHLLWSGLSGEALVEEICPPVQMRTIFDENVYLSIPYGTPGSFNQRDLENGFPDSAGCFTMSRSTNHQLGENNFQIIHRYDQADFFRDGTTLNQPFVDELLRDACH